MHLRWIVSVVVGVFLFIPLGQTQAFSWNQSFDQKINGSHVRVWNKNFHKGKVSFPIGQLVSLNVKDSDGGFKIDEFIKLVSQGMNTEFVSSLSNNGFRRWRGDWDLLGEKLEIGFKRNGNEVSLYFGKYRKSYFEIIKKESFPKLEGSFEISFLQLLFPEAHASDAWGSTQFAGEKYVTIAQNEVMPKILGVAFGVVGVAFIGEAAGRLIGLLVDHFRGDSDDQLEIVKEMERARKSYEKVMSRLRGVTSQVEEVMTLMSKFKKESEKRSFPEIMADLELGMLDREMRLKVQERKVMRYLESPERYPGFCYKDELQDLGVFKRKYHDIAGLFKHLKDEVGLCSILRKGVRKILDAENEVHKVYTNIFSHSIEELSSAIEVAGENRLEAEKQAVKNSKESKSKCRKRVKKLYTNVFKQEAEHLGLLWDVEDTQKEYYKKYCFPLSKWRRKVKRDVRDDLCGSLPGHFFGSPTNDEQWRRAKERVWRLDMERQEKLAKLNEDIVRRKNRDYSRCRKVVVPDRSRVVLNSIHGQLEFLDQMRDDQIQLERDMKKLSQIEEDVESCSF